ncbi:MAG: alpha-amylase family glycosyl hydrolase [Roseimicrobium sp.]
MPHTSSKSGMGAIPYSDAPAGTTFRVWTPFAQKVSVAGNFNGWSPTSHPLVLEGDGIWSTDVPGAITGHEYKFVINDDIWRIDPQARAVTNSVGNGIITDRNFNWRINDFQAPAWNEMVVYQMHLATFPDKPVAPDTLFDQVLNDDNVSYLRELGVNTILLLPTGEFPGDDSWGYNPAHNFAVESHYGGPNELKHFIDKAHEKGFAVMLDVVYNHFGPNDLPTWQFDGWKEDYQGQDMGGIYFYNDWRARTPWGRKNRPDYGRGEVRQYIRDNALMWLEEFRADGLRFDMTVFVRNVDGIDGDAYDDPRNLGGNGWSLLQWVNDEINRRQPWKITMAEDLQVNPWVTKDTGAGGIGFDTQWDGRFLHPVRHVLKQIRDEDRDMHAIRVAIEGKYYNGNPLERVVYTESHDEVAASNGKRRVTEDISPGAADSWHAKKRSTLGAAMVFTSPGIPMIFQAQEILEWIPFGDQNRVDWDKYDRFKGIYYLYRDLIRLRRNWHNNTRGLRGPHVHVCHAGDDKVVVFHRWDQGGPGDDVVMVLNFSTQAFPSYTVGFPRSGEWKVRFNSDWNGYDGSFSNFFSYDTTAQPTPIQGMPCSGNVGIAPYSCIILSQ